ncbi:MAG: hypothetical protein SGJ24_19020 [Chloroflexota bacterium]|nr:hypothetical protein [Chloroflexota bacterium]
MNMSERSEQIFGGTFLIGLALLFITGWWFPGIMFVIGAALLARTYAENKPLTENTGALVLLAIGAFFTMGDVFDWLGGFSLLPLILIGIGVYLLFGDRIRATMGSRTTDTTIAPRDEKPKNDLV